MRRTGRPTTRCSGRPSLSRHIFGAPTRLYKTGIVFLAYLNGHQKHFRMVGGRESARSVAHLGELLVLADAARLLRDPEHACARARPVFELAGDRAVSAPARMSFNQMTADQLSLAEAGGAVRGGRHPLVRPVAPQGRRGRRGRGAADPRRARPARVVAVPRRLLPRAGRGGGQPARGRGGGHAGDGRARARLRPAGGRGTSTAPGRRGRRRRGRAAPAACARARRAARDRAAAPDDDLRALRRRHARRGARPRGAARPCRATSA